MLVGAYHFARPGSGTVNSQVKHFLGVMGDRKGLLPPALDLEVSGGKSAAYCWAWAIEFGMELDAAGIKSRLLYSYPNFFTSNLGNPRYSSGYGLWIASYQRTPWMPRGWRDWTFWQFTAAGNRRQRGDPVVSGVHGLCDVNYFNGSIDDLRRLADGNQPDSLPPLIQRLLKAGFGLKSAWQVRSLLAHWDGSKGTPRPQDSELFRRLVAAGFGPNSAREVIYAMRSEA